MKNTTTKPLALKNGGKTVWNAKVCCSLFCFPLISSLKKIASLIMSLLDVLLIVMFARAILSECIERISHALLVSLLFR